MNQFENEEFVSVRIPKSVFDMIQRAVNTVTTQSTPGDNAQHAAASAAEPAERIQSAAEEENVLVVRNGTKAGPLENPEETAAIFLKAGTAPAEKTKKTSSRAFNLGSVNWKRIGRRSAMAGVFCFAAIGAVSLAGVLKNREAGANAHIAIAQAAPVAPAAPAAAPVAQEALPQLPQSAAASPQEQASAVSMAAQGGESRHAVLPDKRIEVVMGAASEPTRKFFVFSDPVCPFCKKLEPMLERVSKGGYEAHVFPTPLHDQSFDLISSIACANEGQRVSAWLGTINQEKRAGPISCAGVSDVNRRALEFFTQFGFNATPTVVNSKGKVHVGTFASDADLIAFVEDRETVKK